MSRMKPQSAARPSSLQKTAAILWPELVIPSSASPIKGLTPEQEVSFQTWYLGLKNTVNASTASASSNQETLQQQIDAVNKRIDALEKSLNPVAKII